MFKHCLKITGLIIFFYFFFNFNAGLSLACTSYGSNQDDCPSEERCINAICMVRDSGSSCSADTDCTKGGKIGSCQVYRGSAAPLQLCYYPPVKTCATHSDCRQSVNSDLNEYCIDTICYPEGKLQKTDILCQEDANCTQGDKKGVCTGSTFNGVPYRCKYATIDPAPTNLFGDLKIAKPLIEINIPRLNFSDVKSQVDSEGNLSLPWLSEYIAAIYRFAIVIASFFAAAMMILQGFNVVTSGGGEQKTAAYKRMAQIMVGITIVWGSYIILYYINPDLVKFRVLSTKFIPRTDVETILEQGSDNGETVTEETSQSTQSNTTPSTQSNTGAVGGGCLDKKDSAPLQGVADLRGGLSWPVLHKDALAGLQKAMEIAKSREVRLFVSDASRTWDKQQELWTKGLAKTRLEGARQNPPWTEEKIKAKTRLIVAPPSCNSPHVTGRAVDICITGTQSCGHIGAHPSSNLLWVNDKDAKLLADIMESAGWKRYCKEWWHFEYNWNGAPAGTRSPDGCAK